MTAGLQVMREACGECLFSPKRIVSAKRARDVLADCARTDTHFLCHKGTIVGQDIVCAGFYAARSSQAIRMAGRLGIIVMVDGPGAEGKGT